MKFFCVIPPGLEELFVQELTEYSHRLVNLAGRPQVGEILELKPEQGGVSIETSLLMACQIHYWSKICSRILMRLSSFRAVEFYELENRAKKLKLSEWVPETEKFKLKIEASQSRLGNEKRIFETLAKVFKKQLQDTAELTLYVRVQHDEFLFSLDLTGEHLFHRGVLRHLKSPAPLRETLAASLIRFLIQGMPLSELAKTTLLDPMMGSGTLLSEAAHLYSPLIARPFSFDKLKGVPKILKSKDFFKNYQRQDMRPFKSLAGTDLNSQHKESIEQLSAVFPETRWVWVGNGTHDAKSLKLNHGPVLVVCNPPYGKRLERIETPELAKLLSNSDPQRIGVILPEAQGFELKNHLAKSGYQVDFLKVSNGGLPCLLLRAVKKF